MCSPDIPTPQEREIDPPMVPADVPETYQQARRDQAARAKRAYGLRSVINTSGLGLTKPAQTSNARTLLSGAR